MEGNYLSPIIDAFKPILIFAVVLWGIEIIKTVVKPLVSTTGSVNYLGDVWHTTPALMPHVR